jgi:RNA ligase
LKIRGQTHSFSGIEIRRQEMGDKVTTDLARRAVACMRREDLTPYVESGLVTEREHGGLVIYNYTNKCQYDRAWDNVTIRARGLVFDEYDRLITNPFPKFFNHGEPHAVIPRGAPDEIAVKYDGSLGISYVHGGRLCWTTRGCLDSPQSAVAERLWGNGRLPHGVDGWTLLVEIVSPATRIIANHGDQECLVLLAARKLGADVEMSRSDMRALCERTPLVLAETVEIGSFERLLALQKTLPADEEGWVCRWGTHRVKVKGEAYKAAARLLKGLNPRRIADMWYARVADEILPTIPEEHRPWMESVLDALNGEYEELRQLVDTESARVASLSMRDAALAVPPGIRGLVMTHKRGKEPDVRQFVYRTRYNGNPRPVMNAP